MVMFVIFASVLVLMLLGVTTAVTMGFASAATFLLAGGDMARLFRAAAHVCAGLRHHPHVNPVFPSHG
ncbi:MAG: hypothetical protein V8R49_08620 [Duodenibacillus massiliensis]